MFLSAYVRDKQTKETLIIRQQNYKTKKAFKEELQNNGYTVIRISNSQDLAAQDKGFETVTALRKKVRYIQEVYPDKHPKRKMWESELEEVENKSLVAYNA